MYNRISGTRPSSARWLVLSAAPSAADRIALPPRSLGGVGVSRTTRAIIISPHPDDGVLGAGGLIQRIVGRGGGVEVVEMTSGDAFPKGVAAVRHASTPPTADAYRWTDRSANTKCSRQ